MQDESEQVQAASPNTWRKPFFVSLALFLVAALIWNQLPSGAYPTDLSRIGEGRPALVLAFDANYGGGIAVMELMNTIRPDYEDRIDFLIAQFGLPEGLAFASRYNAGDGTVLFFAGDGTNVHRLHLPDSEDQLRQTLDLAFPQ